MRISQALHRGGIEAAYACFAQIAPGEEIVLDADDLVTLALQLASAGKLDLAIDVLTLNLHVFPEHADSRTCLVSLEIKRYERARAQEPMQDTRVRMNQTYGWLLDPKTGHFTRPDLAPIDGAWAAHTMSLDLHGSPDPIGQQRP